MRTEDYLQSIRRELPHLVWQQHRLIDTGADFRVLFLDRRYVVRIAREAAYREVLSAEFEFTAFLRGKLDWETPQMFYLASDHSFGIYDFIPGEQLDASKHQPDLAKIARALGGFLKQLHQLEGHGIRGSAYLPQAIDGVSQDWNSGLSDYFSSSERAEIEEQLRWYDQVKRGGGLRSKLLHGDLHPENILWEEANQKLSIIDFSDRDVADPAYDFSELFELGVAFVNLVLETYSGVPFDYDLAKFYYQIRPLIRIGAYREILDKENRELKIVGEVERWRKRKLI